MTNLDSWYVKVVGNATGEFRLANKTLKLEPGGVYTGDITQPFELKAQTGKLGDSEDSFLYFYRKLDPREMNFLLSVSFLVKVAESDPDYQTGFGIMAADTDAVEGKDCRYRNQLLLGCFGRKHAIGLRAVSGYTDPLAKAANGMRNFDESRLFSQAHNCPVDPFKETIRLTMVKDDRGFLAAWNGEELFFPGCDFLLQQDKDFIYIGFAVARKLAVRISDITFQTMPGRLSHTPEGTIVHHIPYYPFDPLLFEKTAGTKLRTGGEIPKIRAEWCVSPLGRETGDGSPENPVDLKTALARAAAGSRIIMEDGVYRPQSPYYIPDFSCGEQGKEVYLEARHPRKVILDGSNIKDDLPLFVIRGDFWRLRGIVFRNGPASGLVVCGSHNRVEDCEAVTNGDTGILLISWPDAERDKWPQYNLIQDCESHHNCDKVRCNADGFGAKLRVGRGNVFYYCTAYCNVDDGFDLYTKSAIGPIEPVELDCCTAYENGFWHADILKGKKEKTGGSGFKLGGEQQAVAHELWNCSSYNNGNHDFASNSNEACRLYGCTTRPVKKKNILVVMSSLGGGGAERVACRLASEFSKRHQVHLFYRNYKENTYYVAPAVYIHPCIFSNPENRNRVLKRIFAYYFAIRRLLTITLLRFKYDVKTTVSLLNGPNLWNIVAPGTCRKIVSERNDPSHKDTGYRKRADFVNRRADCIVFQTNRIKDMYPNLIRSKGVVIPNPIEVTCKAANRQLKKIVTVGRLHEQKNQKMLIRAFARYHKTHADHHLYLYGEGELLAELQKTVSEYQLKDFVHFEGFVRDVHAAIADAEQFILSSDYEGLPNALMEAMMMGLPCISTACNGSDVLIESGKNGLLVPVGDAEALCDAMCRLSNDPELRMHLGEAASVSAEAWRTENVIRLWERIL